MWGTRDFGDATLAWHRPMWLGIDDKTLTTLVRCAAGTPHKADVTATGPQKYSSGARAPAMFSLA